MLRKLRAFHQSPYRRPYWQMLLLLPLFLLYVPANAYVEWTDRTF